MLPPPYLCFCTISTGALVGCPPLPTVNHHVGSLSLQVIIFIECRVLTSPPPPPITRLNLTLPPPHPASVTYPSYFYPSYFTAVLESPLCQQSGDGCFLFFLSPERERPEPSHLLCALPPTDTSFGKKHLKVEPSSEFIVPPPLLCCELALIRVVLDIGAQTRRSGKLRCRSALCT